MTSVRRLCPSLLAAVALICIARCVPAAADDEIYLQGGQTRGLLRRQHHAVWRRTWSTSKRTCGARSRPQVHDRQPRHLQRDGFRHERAGPRPAAARAHAASTRDVAAWRPDVLVACFGMNDGNYHPFEAGAVRGVPGGRAATARRGARGQGAAVLLTPPPFDPTAARPPTPTPSLRLQVRRHRLRPHPRGRTATSWSRLRDEGSLVADVHTAMNDHLRAAARMSSPLLADAVHPDPTGHWLMAQTLLLKPGTPGQCTTAEIDAAGQWLPARRSHGLVHSRTAGSPSHGGRRFHAARPRWTRVIALGRVHERSIATGSSSADCRQARSTAGRPARASPSHT